MHISLHHCTVRSFTPDDAPAIAKYANNRQIWLALRDAFPHPYSLANAEQFMAFVATQEVETAFAIDVDGEAVGCIGLTLGTDVERCSAEVGYWLGEPFWGQGIVTDALQGFTAWAIDQFNLTRMFAVPFARNDGSCRVLEKAGYAFEGTMRRSAVKDGQVLDQHLYAFVP